MAKKNEFNTPALDLLTGYGGFHTGAQREELDALKLFAAKQFIDNYCENYGVPNEVLTNDPQKLIAWAALQREKEINEPESTWP